MACLDGPTVPHAMPGLALASGDTTSTGMRRLKGRQDGPRNFWSGAIMYRQDCAAVDSAVVQRA